MMRCVSFVFGAALLLLVGCARPPAIVPVAGVVLLNGLPLAKAKVRFVPQLPNSSQHLADGVTDEQGRFTLMCNGQPGACAVESQVVITDEDIPEHLSRTGAREELHAYQQSLTNRPIPEQYRNAAMTPLKVIVSAEQAEYKIELQR